MIIDTKLAIHKSNGNIELAKELLLMLINDLPISLASIKQFFKLNQQHELKDSVHRIHGSTAYCGVPELKIAILSLEKSIKTNDKTDIELKINALELSINTLTEQATRILQQQW